MRPLVAKVAIRVTLAEVRESYRAMLLSVKSLHWRVFFLA